MTQKEQRRRIRKLIGRFEVVNTQYIRCVSARIAHIGTLDAIDLDLLAIFLAMNREIADINAQARDAAQKAVPELYSLYQDDLNATYKSERFARALKERPLSESERRKINRAVREVSEQTAEKMLNLSESTAAYTNYYNAVDRAAEAVRGPSEARAQAIRHIVRETGYRGLQTVYESGQRRRLTLALRESVVSGMKDLRQSVNDLLSEALGFDAKEISAHSNSALDHEPLQGRVFSVEEFRKLQNHQPCKDIDGRHYPAQERAIGELNCRHIAYGFSTERSRRRYTEDELEQMSRRNADGCQIDGKHYSLYEANQLIRRLEAEENRQKDVSVAAEAADDAELKALADRRMADLSKARKRVESKLKRD